MCLYIFVLGASLIILVYGSIFLHMLVVAYEGTRIALVLWKHCHILDF